MGTCTPCLFVGRGEGCRKGQQCEFCHVRHQRKRRDRPCKGRRDRFYRVLETIHAEIEQKAETLVKDPNWFDDYMEKLPGFVHNYPNMKSNIMQGFIAHAEKVLRPQGTTAGGSAGSSTVPRFSIVEEEKVMTLKPRSATSTKTSL